MRVLIIGCGYVGLPLGAALARRGHAVWGLRRNAAVRGELERAGLQPLFGDITRPEQLAGLPREFDWIVNCAASGGGTPEEYRQLYLQGTQNLLDWLRPSPPKKFVYTSSTSVYGQSDGSMVDETSPAEPAAETARVLRQTEQLLLDAAHLDGFPAIILRVAGIYGPGRGHWFRQFLAGQARIEEDGGRILNMVHREDVVGMLMAALERGRPGEIYNAADDEPVSQLVFFRWLSGRLGQPLPPGMPAAARKRGATSKRVSNRKLKSELLYQLKYPTFREGYAAEINAAAT